MSRAFTKERDDAPEAPLVLAKRVENVYQSPADRSVAGYGATVRVVDGHSFDRTFTIVADSQADIGAGLIGMTSPLAQALLDAHVDDRVTWHRPIGDLKLRVLEISYKQT